MDKDNDSGWGFYVIIDLPYNNNGNSLVKFNRPHYEFRRAKITNKLHVIEEVTNLEMGYYEYLYEEEEKEEEKEKEKETAKDNSIISSFCIILLIATFHLLSC